MPSAPPRTVRRRRAGLHRRLAWTLALGLLCVAEPGVAQDDSLNDLLGGVGTAEVADDAQRKLANDLAEGEGTVVGEVIDAETGVPVSGATVILVWPAPDDGSDPDQQVQVTTSAGDFRFPRVPAGQYRLSFIKSGYRVSELQNFPVVAGRVNVADFPLPPRSAAASADVLDLDAFVVEAAVVGDMMNTLEIKMDSDALVDVMGVEDLSKFAASDVADALKRVSGVNVVEGRFAVIRGLEDRYSSTLFNRAPVPSSDPLRQSVQLDLFPSDIVSGIVVKKTFEAESPGNSGAGSIDIGTQGYPDELTVRVGAGTGFNENAIDDFLGYRQNSPIADFYGSGTGVVESDITFSIGGRTDWKQRDFRMKAVYAREIDYDTAIGTIEALEPRIADFSGLVTRPARIRQTGDLALGQLTVSDGLYDWSLSRRTEQLTYFGSVGMDVDRDGDHRIDFTAFHTEKSLQAVDRRDNGYIPGFDYGSLAPDAFLQPNLFRAGTAQAWATVGSMLNDYRDEIEKPGIDPLSFVPIIRGQSIDQDRELSVFQLNGEHDLARLLDGLEFDWAANYARTKQNETAFRMRYWYEPYAIDDNDPPIQTFPPQVEDFMALGPGSFRTSSNDIIYLENAVDEDQWFARGDLTHEAEPLDWLGTRTGVGFWYESSQRTLDFAEYFTANPTGGLPGVVDGTWVEGQSEAELGNNVYYGYELNDLGNPGRSDFSREVIAGYLDLELTLFDDIDVIGGVRLEQVEIDSDNRPFSGDCAPPRGLPSTSDPTRSGLGCPAGYLPRIFPSRYLYLDRLDNRNNPFFLEDPRFVARGVPSGDLLVNIERPVQPSGFVDLLNTNEVFDSVRGEIDELKVLPMAALAYRPLEGLTLRAAYSETTARPSFRELAYYASIVPGIPDRIMGNPFLQLSDVQSFDTRVEYFWGDLGDLFAVGVFYKTIQNPIELIVLRDYSVRGDPLFEGPFRVYRNNENEAKLLGMEAETRVTFDVLSKLGVDGSFLEYFSVGGNYTYIDATVNRSPYEVQIAQAYFFATPDDIASGRVQATGLSNERRLYNQPEWTANADFTFDQPDWGSRLTLSVFAISEVLNAAGAADPLANGKPQAYVLDEFTDGYYQLDLVMSQSFDIPRTPGRWTARVSIKNLTDTERGIVYDPEATNRIYRQRTYTIGRDYSFSLQYQITF